MLERYLGIHNTKELVENDKNEKAAKYLKKCYGEKLIEIKGTLKDAIKNYDDQCLQITLYDEDLFKKDKLFFNRLTKSFNNKVIRVNLQSKDSRKRFGEDAYLNGSQTVGFLKRLFMRDYIKMLFDKDNKDDVIPNSYDPKAYVPANYVIQGDFEMLITKDSTEVKPPRVKKIKKVKPEVTPEGDPAIADLSKATIEEVTELIKDLAVDDIGIVSGDNRIHTPDNIIKYNLYPITEQDFNGLYPFVLSNREFILFNTSLVFEELKDMGKFVTIKNGYIAKHAIDEVNCYFLLTTSKLQLESMGNLQFIASDKLVDMLGLNHA